MPLYMHQTPTRLPPNLPNKAQHSACRSRIRVTVCAASRFRTLTDTSCSSGVQYSRAADFAGHGCGRAAAHLTDDQSDRAPVLHPDIPRTLAYYKKDKLDFGCRGTWQDPPVYAAIVALDQHAIHFCCAQPPKANPDKY